MVAVSTSWSAPDARRLVAGTAFGRPYEQLEQVSPPWRSDLLAAGVTLVVTVLAGAPVGLLWAALAPRAEAVLVDGQYLRADPSSDAYIAADARFFAAALLAGLLSGALAWRLGRRHGPAVVPALAAAGLAAAFVAVRVGEQVGLDELASAVAGRTERVELTLQLGASASLAVWPAVALLTWLALALLRPDPSLSSG